MTVPPVAALAEYGVGTQRICDPEETLRWVTPLAARCGITRVLDMTHLDRIGIPTYSAVRPDGIVLSTSNGKGSTKAAAAVSAIMESIEVEHAEYPTTSNWLLSSSERILRLDGHETVAPKALVQDCMWPADTYGGLHYSPDLLLDWVPGVELIENRPVLLPASTIHVVPPFTQYFTSNGLASGNTRSEATLHGLCELIERDAIARMVGREQSAGPTGILSLALTDLPPHLADLVDGVRRSGIEMFLMNLPSAIDVYSFWCVFFCPDEPAWILATSGGYGCHPNPEIAASRAITEAAQARLAHIQGAREDLGIDHNNVQLSDVEQAARDSLQRRAFSKLRAIPTFTWEQFLLVRPHHAEGLTVDESLELVLQMLEQAGYPKVYWHDLTKADIGVPVTRTFVPGLKISVTML
jgi:ribosomal protein S12 methylthiotransferase accessory factor